MLIAIVLMVPACRAQEAGPGQQDVALPEWLDRVYPPPGAELSSNEAIQVEYEVAGPEQAVRLLIDGTDVTVYADVQRNQLQYDVDEGRAPVELGPGRHAATIELVNAAEYGQQPEVLDRFRWEFTIS